MRAICTISRPDAARRGWETRKANEASRARRFDEVLAENRHLKAELMSVVKTENGEMTLRVDCQDIIDRMPSLLDLIKASSALVQAYDAPFSSGDIFGPVQALRRVLADLSAAGLVRS